MKFKICRTSNRCCGISSEPHCDEAFLTKVTEFLFSTAKTIKEAKKQEWTKNREIKLKNGKIKVYDKEKTYAYAININSISDILKLVKKYGRLIINESNTEDIPMEIEIYDDYRE